jgi:4-azaleucine resistance transporter AzlC
MFAWENIRAAAKAAFPIMLGYVSIGIPCGILSASIGLNAFQVFLMCVLFYSGAGQFMIPNMWLAGSPIASIIASVSFVNTRQMLYSAAFAPWCQKASKRASFLFAATVTDESFGVNMRQFESGGWSVARATLVNLMSQSSWTVSCVVGVLIGNAIGIPLAIAAFAMTSIFICLLVTQDFSASNVVAAVCAMVGVFVCKAIGFAGPAIFVGAIVGVLCAIAFARLRERR